VSLWKEVVNPEVLLNQIEDVNPEVLLNQIEDIE
jgi:hypothetical protein